MAGAALVCNTRWMDANEQTLSAGRQQRLPLRYLAAAAVVGVVLLCIVAASMKTSDRATLAATTAAQAPERFLATELALLKSVAIRGESRVAARLYFGLDECFRGSHPVPLDHENPAKARAALRACAQNQVGALHAAGGDALAREGETLLRNLGLLD